MQKDQEEDILANNGTISFSSNNQKSRGPSNRAQPCPHCGQQFFPSSMKFHVGPCQV